MELPKDPMILFSFINTKVYKKRDFLRPVYKKVKTVTIFMEKMRSCGFPASIKK